MTDTELSDGTDDKGLRHTWVSENWLALLAIAVSVTALFFQVFSYFHVEERVILRVHEFLINCETVLIEDDMKPTDPPETCFINLNAAIINPGNVSVSTGLRVELNNGQGQPEPAQVDERGMLRERDTVMSVQNDQLSMRVLKPNDIRGVLIRLPLSSDERKRLKESDAHVTFYLEAVSGTSGEARQAVSDLPIKMRINYVKVDDAGQILAGKIDGPDRLNNDPLFAVSLLEIRFR